MSLYSPKKRAEIKLQFVQEGKSALEISKSLNGKPSVQTIINWSKKPNSEGSTWELEKEQYEQHQYEKLSPQGLAEKILLQIHRLMEKSPKSFTTKDADALSKLQKVMEKLVDKKFQIPMLFELLTDFATFLRTNYKGLLTDELRNAIIHFKNKIIEERS